MANADNCNFAELLEDGLQRFHAFSNGFLADWMIELSKNIIKIRECISAVSHDRFVQRH